MPLNFKMKPLNTEVDEKNEDSYEMITGAIVYDKLGQDTIVLKFIKAYIYPE